MKDGTLRHIIEKYEILYGEWNLGYENAKGKVGL